MSASRTAPLVAGAVAGVGPQGRYRGMVVSSSAATRVRVYDSTSASGTIIDTVNLTGSGGNNSYWTEYQDVFLTTGLFVEIVSGTPEGSLRFA